MDTNLDVNNIHLLVSTAMHVFQDVPNMMPLRDSMLESQKLSKMKSTFEPND